MNILSNWNNDINLSYRATNSGKTTLCNRLKEYYGHKKITVVTMDDFYVDNHDCSLTKVPELDCYNWENINAVKMSALYEKVQETVNLYNSHADFHICIVEGILVFNYECVLPLLLLFVPSRYL